MRQKMVSMLQLLHPETKNTFIIFPTPFRRKKIFNIFFPWQRSTAAGFSVAASTSRNKKNCL